LKPAETIISRNMKRILKPGRRHGGHHEDDDYVRAREKNVTIWNKLRSVYGPLFSFLLLLVGALGTIFYAATGMGGRFILALFLLMTLVGISMIARERALRDEFFRRKFAASRGSGDSRSESKRRKRIGKKCPQCERVIHHRRAVCQHCGYVFSSKKGFKQKRTSSVAGGE